MNPREKKIDIYKPRTGDETIIVWHTPSMEIHQPITRREGEPRTIDLRGKKTASGTLDILAGFNFSKLLRNKQLKNV